MMAIVMIVLVMEGVVVITFDCRLRHIDKCQLVLLVLDDGIGCQQPGFRTANTESDSGHFKYDYIIITGHICTIITGHIFVSSW